MTERISIHLYSPEQGYEMIKTKIWPWLKVQLEQGHQMVLLAHKEKRSDAQNRVMWARLADVSEQVQWYGRMLTTEDWKHVFSASMRKMDVVPNLEGTGFVALGLATSAMTKSELQDLNEIIMAFGSQRSVAWSVASLCGQTE